MLALLSLFLAIVFFGLWFSAKILSAEKQGINTLLVSTILFTATSYITLIYAFGFNPIGVIAVFCILILIVATLFNLGILASIFSAITVFCAIYLVYDQLKSLIVNHQEVVEQCEIKSGLTEYRKQFALDDDLKALNHKFNQCISINSSIPLSSIASIFKVVKGDDGIEHVYINKLQIEPLSFQ